MQLEAGIDEGQVLTLVEMLATTLTSSCMSGGFPWQGETSEQRVLVLVHLYHSR